jgi:hypothetical protein
MLNLSWVIGLERVIYQVELLVPELMAGLVFWLTEKGASYQVKPTFRTLHCHKTLGKLSRGAFSALIRRELRYRFFRNVECKLK